MTQVDFGRDRVAETKQDIDYVNQALKNCNDKERSKRLQSILTGLIGTQIRNQREIEILGGHRKVSDVIQWLSEFELGTEVRILISKKPIYEGDLDDFVNQESDKAVKAITKMLELHDAFLEPPYIADNVLIVNLIREETEL